MDPLVPPHVERMVPYRPGKPIEELERELGITNAIKLASNENPIGPSPKVIAALRELAPSLHFYPDGAGFSLKQALAKHHGIGADEVCLGNGSNELIDLLARTFPTPDDHIVFGRPSFVCYWLAGTASGVPFTEVPLDNNLAWNIDAMLAACTDKTKLLYIANPNNPTGAHVARADLEKLLRELPERVVCVVDEAYFEFANADDYISALELRGLRERLIVLRTFSKAYGLAGLRVGYAVAPALLIDYLNRMRAPFNVGGLSQHAAVVALTDPEHVQRYVELNARERVRVTSALQEQGFEVAPSQANFVLVNVKKPGAEVYDALLRQGVIVRPMPAPIDQWLRITIGTEAMNDRMLGAMKEIR